MGPESEITKVFEAQQKIDAKGGIVHPGFIDSHLYLTSIAIHGLVLDVEGSGTKFPSYAQIKCETDDEITSAFSSAAAVALLRRGFTFFWEDGTVFRLD